MSNINKWMQMWEENRNLLSEDVKKVDDVVIDIPQHLRKIAGLKEGYSSETPEDVDVNLKKVDVPCSNNPTMLSSSGKDQALRVTPNFTDGKELVELNNIKLAIDQLECKLNAAETLGEKTSSFLSKLKEMRSKFEELSNAIQPNPAKEQS